MSLIDFAETKPILIFDIEATHLDVKEARILEISTVKIEKGKSMDFYTKRFNPEIPIPEESTAIHGIKNEDVDHLPPFRASAAKFQDYISGCILGGYNLTFYDIPVLYFNFERAGIVWDWDKHEVIDSCTIFKRKNPRDLSAAYKFYCGKELENAHTAEADVYATFRVMEMQLKAHRDLNLETITSYSYNDQEWLDIEGKFIKDAQGVARFNFGKHKGKSVLDHPDFIVWMLNANFSTDTKNVAEALLDRVMEEKRIEQEQSLNEEFTFS